MATLKIISIVEPKSRRERRAFSRVQIRADVKVYGVEGCTSSQLCVIKDISLSGICLRTETRIFRVDEEVDIHFAFLPGKPLLPAKVVRVLERLDGVEHGMKFSNLNDQDKKILKEFLCTLLQ